MPKKSATDTDMIEPDDVSFSDVEVETYIVVADPAKKEEARLLYEQRSRCVRETNEKYHKNANGRAIVRQGWLMGGACAFLGVLVRETPCYYIFAEDFHSKGGNVEDCKQARIYKSKAHLEPCHSCADHPHSYYADGSDK